MATKNYLFVKYKDIKYNYGFEAIEYFKKYPYCEKCDEKRLILLHVHHRHGRKVNSFQTLCCHCHILEHHPKNSHHTFDSCIGTYQETKVKNEENRKNKEKKILQLLHENVSMRDIRKIVKGCYLLVRRVARENGFTVKARSGYIKNIGS